MREHASPNGRSSRAPDRPARIGSVELSLTARRTLIWQLSSEASWQASLARACPTCSRNWHCSGWCQRARCRLKPNMLLPRQTFDCMPIHLQPVFRWPCGCPSGAGGFSRTPQPCQRLLAISTTCALEEGGQHATIVDRLGLASHPELQQEMASCKRLRHKTVMAVVYHCDTRTQYRVHRQTHVMHQQYKQRQKAGQRRADRAMQVGTVTPEQRRQRFWHQHAARHFQKRCAHGKHYTCDFRGHVLIRSLHGQSEQPPPLPPPLAPLLLAAPPSLVQAPQAMLAPAPPTPLVPHVAQVPDVDSPLMLLCESSSREVPCFELSARRHFFCFRVVEARPAAQKQIDDNPMARFEPEEMLISLRRILAASPQGQGHSSTVSSEATALQASSACETVFAWKLPPDLSLFQLRTGVLEWETAPALARNVKLLVGIPLEVRDRAQDLVARLIRAGAVEAEGDTPQLAHTVPHSSNNADATSRCLDILRARGSLPRHTLHRASQVAAIGISQSMGHRLCALGRCSREQGPS